MVNKLEFLYQNNVYTSFEKNKKSEDIDVQKKTKDIAENCICDHLKQNQNPILNSDVDVVSFDDFAELNSVNNIVKSVIMENNNINNALEKNKNTLNNQESETKNQVSVAETNFNDSKKKLDKEKILAFIDFNDEGVALAEYVDGESKLLSEITNIFEKEFLNSKDKKIDIHLKKEHVDNLGKLKKNGSVAVPLELIKQKQIKQIIIQSELPLHLKNKFHTINFQTPPVGVNVHNVIVLNEKDQTKILKTIQNYINCSIKFTISINNLNVLKKNKSHKDETHMKDSKQQEMSIKANDYERNNPKKEKIDKQEKKNKPSNNSVEKDQDVYRRDKENKLLRKSAEELNKEKNKLRKEGLKQKDETYEMRQEQDKKLFFEIARIVCEAKIFDLKQMNKSLEDLHQIFKKEDYFNSELKNLLVNHIKNNMDDLVLGGHKVLEIIVYAYNDLVNTREKSKLKGERVQIEQLGRFIKILSHGKII